MARWKALPAGLDPAVLEFVGTLRRIKDESGLGLRQIAAGTGYSTASWVRYLSGRLLPPREAVEALATLTGADATRLLVRHESAAEAWRSQQRRDGAVSEQKPGIHGVQSGLAEAPAQEPAARPVPVVGHDRPVSRLQLALTALVSAAVGAGIAALVLSVGQGGGAGTSTQPLAASQPVSYSCTYVRRAGLWYAGNSTTSTDPLVVDKSGPEVAELQCLLNRVGISPGGIDGNFGPLTEAAVIAAQKKFGLDVDGQVGPHTWAALRG